MASLKSLLNPRDLKTNVMRKAIDEKLPFATKYNKAIDCFQLLWVNPQTKMRVHFIADGVAVLLDKETYEIVGFQIEAWHRDR